MAHYSDMLFPLRSTSEALSSTLWWTTELVRRLPPEAINPFRFFFFFFALIPPTSYIKNVYSNSCWNYCKERSAGLEVPLACLTCLSVFNQISQKDKVRGRQLHLCGSSGPFLETSCSYSPLESNQLLREWEENLLL